MGSGCGQVPSFRAAKVAAVRWPFRWAESRSQLVHEMGALIGQAVDQGADLVALPLHAGTALLGLIYAGIRPLTWDVGIGVALEPGEADEPAVLRRYSGELRRLYQDVYGGLAAAFGVWLAAGSLLSYDERGRLWHEAGLFAPDGRLAGRQRATHRSPLEQQWGVQAATQLDVFATAVGTVGLLIGEDVRYPEVGRILALQGATLLIHLSAGGAKSMPQRLAGLWREVQANQVFGLEAALAPGRAAIHCPVEMAADGRGFLTESEWDEEGTVIVATLDEQTRQRVLTEYDVFSFFNVSWYEQVFPGLYTL